MVIVVRKPTDRLFNYGEVEDFYYSNQKDLGTDESFEKVIKNSDFYSFWNWENVELIGCIYYYRLKGKLYVNAFAHRGHHKVNLDCMKQSMRWYNEPIYAKALHLTSKLCLNRCGFKKIKDNLYEYRR